MTPVDQVRLAFDPTAVGVMNLILALVMFGVALDLRLADFRAVLASPGPVAVGLAAQFLLLPAGTFLLVLALDPAPSVALGMMLIAACPGGNLSNFLTHLARGNTALSIGMTAVATTAALFMTPLNLAFWGSLYAPTRALLTDVAVDPVAMLGLVALLLGAPLAAGIAFARRFPALALRARKPMRLFSIAALILFVAAALAANFHHFLDHFELVVSVVLLHNATALLLGYGAARAAGLPERDRRAVTIEVGIQNSGLGIVLIFNFFAGLGGMALIAGWWGVWHILAGLSLALLWSRRPPAGEAGPGPATEPAREPALEH